MDADGPLRFLILSEPKHVFASFPLSVRSNSKMDKLDEVRPSMCFLRSFHAGLT